MNNRHSYALKIVREEVNPTNGHITFIVRAVEKNEKGQEIGEGPETPVGISVEAMDKAVGQGGFGGHGKAEKLQFLASRKQRIIDAYVQTKEAAQAQVEGEEI